LTKNIISLCWLEFFSDWKLLYHIAFLTGNNGFANKVIVITLLPKVNQTYSVMKAALKEKSFD